MTYLGMQILIEGLALAAFQRLRDMSSNPLHAAVNAYVMQDEARHVAFGRLALRDFYPQLSDAERDEREEFVVEACYHMRDRFDQKRGLGEPGPAGRRVPRGRSTVRHDAASGAACSPGSSPPSRTSASGARACARPTRTWASSSSPTSTPPPSSRTTTASPTTSTRSASSPRPSPRTRRHLRILRASRPPGAPTGVETVLTPVGASLSYALEEYLFLVLPMVSMVAMVVTLRSHRQVIGDVERKAAAERHLAVKWTVCCPRGSGSSMTQYPSPIEFSVALGRIQKQ